MKANKVTVKEFMNKEPSSIHADHTVRHAARLMKDRNCGVLPVLDDEDTIIGMVTDRDLVLRVLATGKEPVTTLARDIMTKAVHCCSEDASPEYAADLMLAYKVGRLIVTKGEKVVGIISLAELVRNVGDENVARKIVHHLLQSEESECYGSYQINEECI